MDRFAEKSILVTGASSGIGRKTAVAVSREGGRVVLIGRDETKLQETLEQMERPSEHITIAYDLCDFDHYKEIFSMIKREGIILNGMVHCAGETSITPLRTLKRADGMRMMDIHLFAFLELTKNYAKKGMSNGGSIVGISAINSHVPQKCMTIYASAKAAMECACRTMAVELAEKNIRINSVVVGGIDNKMKGVQALEGIESDYDSPVSRQVLGIGSVDQVVAPILFLLSDDSGFMTGRELYADGGLL